ncbi:MAG: DEAD/DEAH box helicase family protein [bacterium]|nr:DEAD/DEAH box helicase family protein [bacterium]
MTNRQLLAIIPLFYAQREAVETIIWLREVATRRSPLRRRLEEESRRFNDGLVRYCSKMATGTGKTTVMGMLVAWQTLNATRTARRRNLVHSERFLVLAPGHTVRERLEVLRPSHPDNVYDEMGLVPTDKRARLNQARVSVVNFQAFGRRDLLDFAPGRRLMGSDADHMRETRTQAVQRVVGDLLSGGGYGNLCVMNDEAHHCYNPDGMVNGGVGSAGGEGEQAAVWFNTLRTLRDMGALGRVGEYGQESTVFDFSATPFWINMAGRAEPDQFQWVASEFGLMESIESGLVKVPRVPIDDDSTRDETVWRRLHKNTFPKDLKGQRGLPEPLNGALSAVAADWKRTLDVWQEGGQPTPPVLIVVANNIRNAEAIFDYIAGGYGDDGSPRRGAFPELSNIDENGQWYASPRTLIVHSKFGKEDTVPPALKRRLAEAAGMTQKDAETAVRIMLNTVGKQGREGAPVRCVVSVSMLTEGWDARTVTHIVGYRPFVTQLLCEQVTGRALRRTAYDHFRPADPDGRRRLVAEYADVVGIPFEFMPASDSPTPPPDPKPRTRVQTVADRESLRMVWPQVAEYLTRAEQVRFHLDPARVSPYRMGDPWHPTMTLVRGVAGEEQILGQDPTARQQRTAHLEVAARLVRRLQTSEAADVDGSGEIELFRSAYRAVRDWATHPAVDCHPHYPALAAAETIEEVCDRILNACVFGKTPPVRFARLARPVGLLDTSRVDFETTLEHIHPTIRSELSHAACHSTIELRVAELLDQDSRVERWVRNFQLGWSILYHMEGAWRRYEPDFIARLDDGTNLIVECKGLVDDKAEATARWTRDHWIPSIAGTSELPDALRRWSFRMIRPSQTVAHDLHQAIKSALTDIGDYQ